METETETETETKEGRWRGVAVGDDAVDGAFEWWRGSEWWSFNKFSDYHEQRLRMDQYV